MFSLPRILQRQDYRRRRREQFFGRAVVDALRIAVGRQAHADAAAAPHLAHRIEHLEQQARAVLARAAVGSAALIAAVAQELVEQVAVGTVHFHAVEAGGTGVLGRMGEAGDDGRQLVVAQCARHHVGLLALRRMDLVAGDRERAPEPHVCRSRLLWLAALQPRQRAAGGTRGRADRLVTALGATGEGFGHRGDDAAPYSHAELTAKFMDLTGRVWPAAHGEAVLAQTLEQADRLGIPAALLRPQRFWSSGCAETRPRGRARRAPPSWSGARTPGR